MADLDYQVVVVGAGPVGLVTALGLAKLGHSVLLLEQNSAEVPAQWRGSTIHPPTLEIFDGLGLAEEIINGAVKVEVLQYRDLEIPEVVDFDYQVLRGKVKFPFRLQFEQYKVLKLLRTKAAENPKIEIRYDSKVLGISQDFGSVTLEISTKDRVYKVNCGWLAAADGSHSSVRKSLGIELTGFTYPFPTTVVATPFAFEDHFPGLAPVTYWSGPTGRLSMIRTPDIWRIAMTTPLEGVDLSSEDKGTITEPTADFKAAVSLLLKLIPGVTLADLQLKQYEVYRSHQRVAGQFSLGRVALAGDAAHLTTTNGGMGLNSGVQDAAALVAAIDEAIAKGGAEPIERYGMERKEFCESFLQPTTSANHKTVDNPDFDSRKMRLANLSSDANDPQIELEVVARASMLTQILK